MVVNTYRAKIGIFTVLYVVEVGGKSMETDLKRPVPAVGALIIKDDEILLIKRGHEPGAGKWSIPGGSVELGETLVEAVKRETKEETGLDVEVGALAGIYELVVRDDEGDIRFHYILMDYFATANPGVPVAATDAVDCRWVPLSEIRNYDVTKSLNECLIANKLITEV